MICAGFGPFDVEGADTRWQSGNTQSTIEKAHIDVMKLDPYCVNPREYRECSLILVLPNSHPYSIAVNIAKLPLRLVYEFIDSKDLVSAHFEPFGAAARDLTASSLQDGLDRAR